MTKKALYAFALLGVAVVLGAAGCQQQGDDAMNVDGNQPQNAADMQAEDNAESNAGMMNDENGSSATPDEGAMMEDQTNTDAMMEDSEVKTLTVEGQNFSYSPNTISVNKGDKVKVIFKNVGGTHDWNLDEFGAKTPVIQAGETAEVTFTADKAGTFEYYCSVGTHRALGMVGTLTVE